MSEELQQKVRELADRLFNKPDGPLSAFNLDFEKLCSLEEDLNE